MTILLQQQGIAVAYASIAYPNPDDITRQESQYYQYQARNHWKLHAFSLHRYSADIHANNRTLRELSKTHNAFYIPIAETIHGGANVFVDFCHMTQTGIATKADVFYDFVCKILDSHFQEIHRDESVTE